MNNRKEQNKIFKNYMKTKKALGGLFGLLGSLAALPLPAGFLALAGAPFLFTASLKFGAKSMKSKINRDLRSEIQKVLNYNFVVYFAAGNIS